MSDQDQWSLDQLLPDVPSRFDAIDLQPPQSFPDDSWHKSEEPWSPLLHDPISLSTLNSMPKGLATVIRDDSQCSTISPDSGYYSIPGDSSRILASKSFSEQLSFTWGKTVGSGLQHRLETSEEAPEALAMAALTTSVNRPRQLALIPPITNQHDTAQILDFGVEPLAVRLKQFPENFDDTKCNFPSQPRSHDYLASEPYSEMRGLQDGSEQDPWDPLCIYRGKTLPIMNHDASYGAHGSIQQGERDYHSAGNGRIQSLAESQETGVASGTAMLTDSARRSFVLQASSFSPSNQTISTLHSLNTLDRNADGVVQTYERAAPSEKSSTSTSGLRDRSSTAAEKTAIKPAPLMQNCGICQERGVQCSHPQPLRWNSPAKATTTSEHLVDYSDGQQDPKNCGKYGETSKHMRECRTHDSSQSQTDISDTSMSLQSENTSASPSQSPCGSFDLKIVQAKHRLMVTLMKEVYAMFDSKWKVGVRTCGTSQQRSSETYTQSSQLEASRGSKNAKRRFNDRDISPPGDDVGKRKKSDDPETVLQQSRRLFACPFHKYDPYKYSLNSHVGSKYRSCLGPGFKFVSHVTQHLKRVHRAPIQCQRCWFIMPNLQAMNAHANMDTRCESRPPQPEGVDQEKLDHILSIRGITWKKVYEILFPGAEPPSPYFEAQAQSAETFPPSSPATQEFEEFEAYNRRALPQLVEANLQAMVNAEMVPIEENLRRLFVDVVRRCQSTVAENYRLIREPRVSNNPPQLPSSHTVPTLPHREDISPTNSQLLAPTMANTTSYFSDFFEEPPHVGVEARPSSLRLLESADRQASIPTHFADSGYASSLEACSCTCHCGGEIDDVMNADTGNCSDCFIKRCYPWNHSMQDVGTFFDM